MIARGINGANRPKGANIIATRPVVKVTGMRAKIRIAMNAATKICSGILSKKIPALRINPSNLNATRTNARINKKEMSSIFPPFHRVFYDSRGVLVSFSFQ